MAEWISVDEELPPVGEKVLCICDTGYEGMPVYGIGWRVSGDFWHVLVLLGKNPTVLAWMPLPPKPEESESMTPKEAIRPLKELSTRKKMADQCDQASASDIRLYHALDTAIKAVEKQIQKKPVIDPVDCAEVCPNCKSTGIREDYGAPNDYCSECGQAIDWSE